jgi:hypothetical protein
MAIALSLPMNPALNPLPARYVVRVLVLRADGAQLSAEDKASIREAFPEKGAPTLPSGARTAKKSTKPRRKPAMPRDESKGTAPKRAAAKRPTR